MKYIFILIFSFLSVSVTFAQTQPEKLKTDIFTTKMIPGDSGFYWTITSLLGKALSDAESFFGERDKQYTLLGVEICQDKTRPHTGYRGNGKDLIIQITRGCDTNFSRAIFQMSHEVIHCLAPFGSDSFNNVLEDGLAHLFSISFCEINNFGVYEKGTDAYADAYDLVYKLLSIDMDIIKKVRKIQPVISKITPEDLLKTNKAIPKELAIALCKKFVYK